MKQNPARPVVFITGASAGIGAAAAEVFVAAGYDVVLGARRMDRLEKIAGSLATRFSTARLIPVVCDVTSDASVESAFKKIHEEFGALDALVNNAGYGGYGSVEEMPLDAFRANMETNFFGVLRCTKAALPLLRAAAKNSTRRWGAAIVMVSSIVGRRAFPLASAYCATKFAVEGLSESLRLELWNERISVSVVNPGLTNSEFFDASAGLRPSTFLSPDRGMTPQAVAKVLLRAVAHPRRNRYLTAAGKAGVFFEWLCPEIFDRVLLRTLNKTKK